MRSHFVFGSLCASLLFSMAPSAHAAAPLAGAGKLEPRLAAIADAVAENRADRMMSAAIGREMFLENTPAEPRWNAAGQVQVYLHYDRSGHPPTADELTRLGATDVLLSRELGVVQAWIPASELANAAQLGDVARVGVPHYARTHRTLTPKAQTRTGSVETQGDSILGAAQFRATTGLTGTGMTVAVISNGDDNIAADKTTGDLPGNIWNDPADASTFKSSGDEGTAMMEIVYDLAPGVKQLGFCGPQTTAEFLTCLNDFASNIGPDVIVDDLGFPGEAMFTDGDFATSVQAFATANPQTQLVSAAGNDGTSFWSGSWSGATPVSVGTTVNGVSYTQALNFGTSGSPDPKLTFTVKGGDTINYVVEWDDPWDDKSTTNLNTHDYDVVLFNSVSTFNDSTAVACNQGDNINSSSSGLCNQTNSNPLNTPGPTPVQGSSWKNNGGNATLTLQVFLSPNSPNPPGNNFKILVFSQQSSQVTLSHMVPADSIFGQAAVPGELAVGAVPASSPSTIESFSSQGPVQLGIPGSGAGTKSNETRQKPDFVATDGVSVTGVGGFPSLFFGTSAAAPHIAGLWALLKSAYPSRTPLSLLLESTVPLGTSPPNGVYGNGRPNVDLLVTTLNDFPPPVPTMLALSTIKVGTNAQFFGSCNAAGASGTPTLDWNFGSGSGVADSTQANPAVVFNIQGSYTVTLTCTDTIGSRSTNIGVVVTLPPVATISTPSGNASVQAGTTANFVGSCNLLGAHETPTIDWNFGSGSGLTDSNQASTSVAFPKTGTYTVTLTCSDSIGSGTTSVNVNVTAASSGGGGGGDLGLLELAGLFSALAFSRRRRARH